MYGVFHSSPMYPYDSAGLSAVRHTEAAARQRCQELAAIEAAACGGTVVERKTPCFHCLVVPGNGQAGDEFFVDLIKDHD